MDKVKMHKCNKSSLCIEPHCPHKGAHRKTVQCAGTCLSKLPNIRCIPVHVLPGQDMCPSIVEIDNADGIYNSTLGV